MPRHAYGPSFQRWLDESARRSAQVVAPIVYDLLAPKSVVDVGCGNGAWLAEFKRLGATRVLGTDGDYVDLDSLAIDRSEFMPSDLSQPLTIEGKFDLAMSLETAEHLPSTQADAFVARLVALAPVVLFSAAVPHQGGVGHINEQWPEYWAERFERHDYAVADCLRPRVWNHPDVSFWYAQNTLVFAGDDARSANPELDRMVRETENRPLRQVHPTAYLEKVFVPAVTPRAILRSATNWAERVARNVVRRAEGLKERQTSNPGRPGISSNSSRGSTGA